MKRTAQFILAFALAASAHATDRVVSASGTYNTISSAIAASSDGDRILVEPGTYTGDVQLDKDLFLLPAVEGARYFLNGSVRVAGGDAPRRVVISGIHAGYFSTYGGTARLDVVLIDSYFNGVDGYNADPSGKHHIELYRDSIPTGIILRSGSAYGCVIGGFIATTQSAVNVYGTTTLTDPVRIVGNELAYTPGYSTNSAYSIHVTASVPFQIDNNYVNVWGSSSKFIQVDGTPPFGQTNSSICNNIFRRFLGSSASATINGTSSGISVDVRNNATIGQTGALIDWPNRSGGTSNNLTTADAAINTSTGQPVGGSPLIDAGDPDPRYLDLDLTVNDVGCYGGSHSRENFTTPMGSAVVGFMQAPRVVAQGEPVNISVTGFDR
jgi:hypothetical protein